MLLFRVNGNVERIDGWRVANDPSQFICSPPVAVHVPACLCGQHRTVSPGQRVATDSQLPHPLRTTTFVSSPDAAVAGRGHRPLSSSRLRGWPACCPRRKPHKKQGSVMEHSRLLLCTESISLSRCFSLSSSFYRALPGDTTTNIPGVSPSARGSGTPWESSGWPSWPVLSLRHSLRSDSIQTRAFGRLLITSRQIGMAMPAGPLCCRDSRLPDSS